ncbi:hypothetical protein EJ04DRAFT_562625 [Polyplosphaeria fusca]|uniref:Uncharacterized protein n=1 Tax=Polyplosphaeria fusca TaxID=682080 RepID=A0A9P4R381_9PLEO|nr:hypothetical protein EJ04DRAFT_562625 [Polyplosphaeria fusca]
MTTKQDEEATPIVASGSAETLATHVTVTNGLAQLTETNLAKHNLSPFEEDSRARVERLQKAADELGFELSAECFEHEK